ncbi:MAG: hypothetical protein U0841_02340 [Chloroflexia bacterium]
MTTYSKLPPQISGDPATPSPSPSPSPTPAPSASPSPVPSPPPTGNGGNLPGLPNTGAGGQSGTTPPAWLWLLFTPVALIAPLTSCATAAGHA